MNGGMQLLVMVEEVQHTLGIIWLIPEHGM